MSTKPGHTTQPSGTSMTTAPGSTSRPGPTRATRPSRISTSAAPSRPAAGSTTRPPFRIVIRSPRLDLVRSHHRARHRRGRASTPAPAPTAPSGSSTTLSSGPPGAAPGSLRRLSASRYSTAIGPRPRWRPCSRMTDREPSANLRARSRPPGHRPRVHDDGVGGGAAQPVRGHAEALEVLAQGREEVAAHALELHPQQHDDVGPLDRLVDRRGCAHPEPRHVRQHQGGRPARADVGPEGPGAAAVRAGTPGCGAGPR